MNQDPALFAPELQARREALASAQSRMAEAETASQLWPALQHGLMLTVPVALRQWRRQLKGLPATIWPAVRLHFQQRYTLLRVWWIRRHPRPLWFRANNARMRWLLSWRRGGPDSR